MADDVTTTADQLVSAFEEFLASVSIGPCQASAGVVVRAG